MGVVWEAYHKGVPLLGVPENPIENTEKKTNPSRYETHNKHLHVRNISAPSLATGQVYLHVAIHPGIREKNGYDIYI